MKTNSESYLEITELTQRSEKPRRLSTKEIQCLMIPRQRIKYLWSRARKFARVLGKLNKINKDIRIYGSTTYNPEGKGQDFQSTSKNHKYLFMPSSTFKICWNTLIIFVTLYAATVLPYIVCFGLYNQNWLIFDLIVDGFYMIDIPINFFSAFFDLSGRLVTSHKMIAKSYLKSWFFFDFISCLPFEMMDFTGNGSQKFSDFRNFLNVGRLYKIIRMARLLKMLRLFKINSIESFILHLPISTNTIKLFIFGSALFISVHIFACFWFYMSDDTNEYSWVLRFDVLDKSSFEKYLTCIYYVFTTLTTIGYGDIVPCNNNEKLYAIFLMVFGACLYSYIISGLSAYSKAREKLTSEYKEKMNGYKEFGKAIKLPSDLFEKMKKILKFHLMNNSHLKHYKFQFLKDIPSFVREEVLEHVNKNVVKGIYFFDDKSRIFINNFVPYLKTSIFIKKDVIFNYREVSEEVYFIKKGRIYMKAPNKLVFRIYVEGSYFGEIEIFEQSLRDCLCDVGSAEAELLVIKKKNFLKILEEFPDVREEMKTTAKIKKAKHLESKSRVVELALLKDDDNSLITESDSSDISAGSIKNERIMRQDTGVLVSLEHESDSKRRFRKLWSTVLSKDPKKSIFHRTKTMMKKKSRKTNKSRSYSMFRKNENRDLSVFTKKRSMSGEVLYISSLPQELKIDMKHLKEDSNDYVKRLELNELSFDSIDTPLRDDGQGFKFTSKLEFILSGGNSLRDRIDEAV